MQFDCQALIERWMTGDNGPLIWSYHALHAVYSKQCSFQFTFQQTFLANMKTDQFHNQRQKKWNYRVEFKQWYLSGAQLRWMSSWFAEKNNFTFLSIFFYVSSKSIQRKKMTRNFTKNAFSVLYHNIIVSQQHILLCSLFLWMCIIIPICFMCAHDEINRCSFPVVTIFSVPSGFSHFRRVRAHFMTDDCNRLSFSLQFDLNLFAAAATIA